MSEHDSHALPRAGAGSRPADTAGGDALGGIGRSAVQLRERAAQYRRMAARLHDGDAQRRLEAVADEFEADAAALEAHGKAAEDLDG